MREEQQVKIWLFLFLFIRAGRCCNFVDSIVKKAATMKVSDQGLHRRLLIKASLEGSKRFVDCQVAFRLVIPAGAYVDFDNLDKTISYFIVYAKFDVEAPEERSTATPIFIFSRKLLRKTFVFYQRLEVPVHLRYHRPDVKSEAIVNFKPPSILLHCENNATSLKEESCKNYIIMAPCDSSSNYSCEWVSLKSDSLQSIEVVLPVGNLKSLDVVFAGTFFIVTACINAVVFSSYWTSR